jgi:hypothetical protein
LAQVTKLSDQIFCFPYASARASPTPFILPYKVSLSYFKRYSAFAVSTTLLA